MNVDWEMIEQHPIDNWQDYYNLACPICGCGSGEVRDLLHECLEWAASGDKRFEKTGSEWDKGFYRSTAHELAAHVLDHAGLLEHGSGIGWAWVTADGERLLTMVREQMKREQQEAHGR
jgi:hypothetical protein